MKFELDKLVRENIKKMTPYSSARHEFAGEAAIFLDANENSFGSPLQENYNRYPDPLQQKLKEKISAAAEAGLIAALAAARGPVILVSNEVGLGLVPETPLGREFRDAQGRVNQAVAAACGRVVFVAAGLPLVLKPAAPER